MSLNLMTYFSYFSLLNLTIWQRTEIELLNLCVQYQKILANFEKSFQSVGYTVNSDYEKRVISLNAEYFISFVSIMS